MESKIAVGDRVRINNKKGGRPVYGTVTGVSEGNVQVEWPAKWRATIPANFHPDELVQVPNKE